MGNLSLQIPSKIRSDEDKAMDKISEVLVLSWWRSEDWCMEDSVKLAEQIFGATGNLSFYVPSKISSNNNEVYVKIPERLE